MERCIRINAENGQKVGFKITKTVVTDVNPGGLADNAGLKVGDRLVKVDGYSCHDMRPENIINFIKVSGAMLTYKVVFMTVFSQIYTLLDLLNSLFVDWNLSKLLTKLKIKIDKGK